MDTYGVQRVVGVYNPNISFCIFKQIIDMMPIPVGVVPVLVKEFLTVYIYSPGFLNFPKALSFRPHYKKSFQRLLDKTEMGSKS